jgi:hypothetical protein
MILFKVYFVNMFMVEFFRRIVAYPKNYFFYIVALFIVFVLIENVFSKSISSYINFRLFALIVVFFGIFYLIDKVLK